MDLVLAFIAGAACATFLILFLRRSAGAEGSGLLAELRRQLAEFDAGQLRELDGSVRL